MTKYMEQSIAVLVRNGVPEARARLACNLPAEARKAAGAAIDAACESDDPAATFLALCLGTILLQDAIDEAQDLLPIAIFTGGLDDA